MPVLNLERIRTLSDVDKWVADGGEIRALRAAIENPQLQKFEHHSLPILRAWFLQREDQREDAALESQRLSASAADRAAVAAESSAKSAKQSVWAAAIAAGLSVVALMVSVAGLFK